jgi:hypothetical protein
MSAPAPRPTPLSAAATLLALLAAACATDAPLTPGTPKVVAEKAIAPYEFHEECMHLERGDRLDYRFESDQPLAFNIRYHEQNLVLMPITRTAITSDAAIFSPVVAQDYCLTWEAGPSGAVLSYRVVLRRPRP